MPIRKGNILLLILLVVVPRRSPCFTLEGLSSEVKLIVFNNSPELRASSCEAVRVGERDRKGGRGGEG